MGKIVTPKYRIELLGINRPKGSHELMSTIYSWNKEYGKPTASNIGKWIIKMTDSFKIGGVNEHVSKSLGYIPIPSSARIVNQKTGDVVAIWKASLFWVI